MNTFDEKEFMVLKDRFNKNAYEKEVEVFCNEEYFNRTRDNIRNDRRGEVVFGVARPNGKVITITCEGYPSGIFRIPTGGIGYGEDIVDAVYREVKEELGIDVCIEEFIGVLKLKHIYKNEQAMFYSYLFFLNETGGRLLEDAEDDEVSEVREAGPDELEITAQRLKNIKGKWHDWGNFRYETTNAILKYFKSKGKIRE